MSQPVMAQRTPFGLVGEFLGFVSTKHPQPRAIKLRWLDQEIVIRIAKNLRGDRELEHWIPGMQVQAWGTQHFSEKRSQVKFKAHRLLSWKADSEDAVIPNEAAIPSKLVILNEALLPSEDQLTQAEPALKTVASPKPIVLKICTKSDCRARGGQKLCTMLNREVINGSWSTPVTVREIGCIGKCKSGPHLLVSPDKVVYSNLKPRDVLGILDRHLKPST